jgi:aryl-alcohol dehydrogenase-like predicted oxidoreductase
MEKPKLQALLRGAFDRGIRTFDLAHLYGTHPHLLLALKAMPFRNSARRQRWSRWEGAI